MVSTGFYVVVGLVTAAVALSWVYFCRLPIKRPPLGVFNLGDIAIMLIGIVLVPLLYLALPRYVVAGMLTLGTLSILSLTLEPLISSVWVRWPIITALVAADLVLAPWDSPMSRAFLVVNNIVLILMVIGITNLWAQSGMKARDVAVLGAALMLYDVIATSLLPMMTNLFIHIAGLPFAPLVAWYQGTDDRWLALGLGDVLLGTVFPLVLRKAYGPTAGRIAMLISIATIAVFNALIALGIVQVALPVMVGLGPLMVLQYIYWRSRSGTERTSWQYLQAEPLSKRAV